MTAVLLSGLLLEFILRIGWFDYVDTLVILGIVAYEGKESYQEVRERFESSRNLQHH